MIRLVSDQPGLSFDDVLLEPRYSDISSRMSDEVDLSTEIVEGLKLRYPLVTAPMDSITGRAMVQAMAKLGGLGIPHRFMLADEQKTIHSLCGYPCVFCIGVGESGFDYFEAMEPRILRPNAVLIDIAHGHCKGMLDQIKRLVVHYPYIPIIAGNIATKEAATELIAAGVTCLKAGIGPGSLCTTRVKTGNGVPQLTAISEVAEVAHRAGVKVIADGGVRSSGDCVKALAAGADAVMIGALFAGTTEALGKVYTDSLSHEGPYKLYRGLASRAAQEDWKGYATSIEGELTRVPFKGSVEPIFNDLVTGIKSGMSYQGAHNLQELRNNARFILQTPAGLRESLPHGVMR